MLKPNEIRITVEKDRVYVDDFRKGEGFTEFSNVGAYVERLIRKKYKELELYVEYIPEFPEGTLVTLKNSPGYSIFKVRKNFGMHCEVEKIEKTYLEKISDMTFYVHRVSLVEYKGGKDKC
jgi:hypothetical protein